MGCSSTTTATARGVALRERAACGACIQLGGGMATQAVRHGACLSLELGYSLGMRTLCTALAQNGRVVRGVCVVCVGAVHVKLSCVSAKRAGFVLGSVCVYKE